MTVARDAHQPVAGSRSPAPGRVVVIGGYGAVGAAVAEALAEAGREVVIAGRRPGEAMAAAARLGPSVRGAYVDASDAASVEHVVDGASVVVMCVERDNVSIARHCLERSIAYIDVSATAQVVDAIGDLDGLARMHSATALVSVGLAPGITNLLARMAHRALPATREIDVTLCFGLAGDNGPDSRRWILDGLSGPAAGRSARTSLPGFGRRRAFPFPFSDQARIAESLGVRSVTRLCFESAAVTSVVFALRRLGVFAAARRLGLSRVVQRGMGAWRVGTDRFAVQAAATVGEEWVGFAVTGQGECRATGLVTAAVVELVLEGAVPAGVHHLDAVVDEGFLAGLSDALSVHGPVRRTAGRDGRRRSAA